MCGHLVLDHKRLEHQQAVELANLQCIRRRRQAVSRRGRWNSDSNTGKSEPEMNSKATGCCAVLDVYRRLELDHFRAATWN